MKKKLNSKVQAALPLEQVLWNCRVALRGIGSTEKNRDAVISLVFLKFAGDKFESQRKAIVEKYGDDPAFLESVAFYEADNVFYLPPEARWSELAANASANDIAVRIDRAMVKAEEANRSLKGTLPRNLFASLGAEKAKIKALIDNVAQIDEARFGAEDLIGRVYEYFLQVYAASGTKEDGEFYTPACIVQLIAELIEPFSGRVYDPCCGSGGMFVQSMKFVDSHRGDRRNVSILGQESNPDTWRLCKMNLAIRGIAHDLGDTAVSTFARDLHRDRKVDFIMANPPFNLKDWRSENELKNDPRFVGYSAMPPVANANYAWILHILSKLDVSHGIAGFLMANGALNADGAEAVLRREILERDRVEAIIVLPRDMFYTTDLSVTLWIVTMNKKAIAASGRRLRDRSGEVLFVDLRRWDENVEEIAIDKGKKKKKTVLTAGQIAKVKALFESWREEDGAYADVPELCRSATLDEIAQKGWSLAPSKYIEFVDRDLGIDYEQEMARLQGEMRAVLAAERDSQRLLADAFRGIGHAID